MDMWYEICDMWHVTCDIQYLIYMQYTCTIFYNHVQTWLCDWLVSGLNDKWVCNWLMEGFDGLVNQWIFRSIGWLRLDHSWTTCFDMFCLNSRGLMNFSGWSWRMTSLWKARWRTKQDQDRASSYANPMTPTKLRTNFQSLRTQDTTSLWPRSLAHSSGIFPTPRRFSLWPGLGGLDP